MVMPIFLIDWFIVRANQSQRSKTWSFDTRLFLILTLSLAKNHQESFFNNYVEVNIFIYIRGGQQLGLNNNALLYIAKIHVHSRNSGLLHTVSIAACISRKNIKLDLESIMDD